MPKNWFNLSAKQSLAELNADPERGLSNSAAESRLNEYGLNELQASSRISIPALLFAQLKNLTRYPLTRHWIPILVCKCSIGVIKQNPASAGFFFALGAGHRCMCFFVFGSDFRQRVTGHAQSGARHLLL